MGEEKIPYSTVFAYLFKLHWAAGERILRVFLLNRRAPEVGDIERNVSYVERGGRLQKLDVFVPPSEPPYPVLVYIHGGGNHVGDKRTYDRICRTFASHGYLVCNANYRMAPRCGYREQLQDAAAAVSWARAHAQGYGGDAERVFLAGDSAGAYHAAMYAAEALHPEVGQALGVPSCIPPACIRGLLLFYGVYDLVTVGDCGFPFGRMLITGFLGRDPELFREGAELASPVRYITPDFPPCFLATSEIDQLHSQTLEFARILEERGVESELLNLTRKEHPLTYHGFLNFWYTRGAALAMDGALRFLARRRE